MLMKACTRGLMTTPVAASLTASGAKNIQSDLPAPVAISQKHHDRVGLLQFFLSGGISRKGSKITNSVSYENYS